MRDALKSYLALAGSVTEVTRQRAQAAAKALVAQGEATAEQVTSLADDLLSQTRQNREAVTALVGYEVDRALGRIGLASADEVTALTERVRALEAQLSASAPAKQAPGEQDPREQGPGEEGRGEQGPGEAGPGEQGPGEEGPREARGPDELGVTLPDGVGTALARLEHLPDLPVADHVEVLDEVHRLLQDALATLDEA